MHLRQRSKKNEVDLQHVKPTDIEVGGKLKCEKKRRLKLKTASSLYNFQQRFVVGADRVTVCLVGFTALILALDIAAFANTAKGNILTKEQVIFEYESSRTPAHAFESSSLIDIPTDVETIDIANDGTNNMWKYIPNELWNLKPDFDGLIIAPLEDGEQRYIKESDQDKIEHLLTEEYYEWDDGEEIDDANCKAPSWYKTYTPNCNNFHEINVGLGKYLASGYFR